MPAASILTGPVAKIHEMWPVVFPNWDRKWSEPLHLCRGVLTVVVHGEDVGRQVASCEGLTERASKAGGATVRRIKLVNLNQPMDDSRRECPIQRSTLRRVIGILGCGHPWKGGLNVGKHPAAAKVRKAAILLRAALATLDEERSESEQE